MNFVLSSLGNILNDWIKLFFPNICLVCGTNLVTQEKFICVRCLYNIPKTGYNKIENNYVSKLFWGRANIQFATSYCYFSKGSRVQKLMYELKYKGQKELGIELGKYIGISLVDSIFINNIDMVIPIPLHKKRLNNRGYNQSEYLAKGVADILKVPVNSNAIMRSINNATQTKKGKLERWQNVKSIFRVLLPELIKNKNILLVDDVITTGATLDACANEILKISGTKVSIATYAVAKDI